MCHGTDIFPQETLTRGRLVYMYCGDTVQRKEGSCVNESQEWKKRAHVQEEGVNDEQTENLT